MIDWWWLIVAYLAGGFSLAIGGWLTVLTYGKEIYKETKDEK